MVLTPVRVDGIKAAPVARVLGSITAATRDLRGVAVRSAATAAEACITPGRDRAKGRDNGREFDVGCLAQVGVNARAMRVVGVLIKRRGRKFAIEFVVVDVATARELVRRSHVLRAGRLRRDAGTLLARLLASPLAAATGTAPGAGTAAGRGPGMAAVSTPAARIARGAVARTVVLPAAARPSGKRYQTRVRRALESAVNRMERVNMTATPRGDAACAANPACVAKAGAAAGAERAVGIWVIGKRRGFTLACVMVDVASGRALARRQQFFAPSAALAEDIGRWLADLLGLAWIAAADGAAAVGDGAAPLRVSVANRAVGDGRTAVPVAVLGGPPPRVGELARVPELPQIACQGAVTLPALAGTPPAILPPVVTRARQIACVARHRGAQVSFDLVIEPPGPGLYAVAPRAPVPAQGPAVKMPVVSIQVSTRGRRALRPTTRLRATASAGRIETGPNRDLTLTLPPGRAPRVIAVALVDGERTGAAFVSVAGTAMLPVAAARRSDVMVRIAGEWHGPILTRRGRARVPIAVLPGATRAVIRATDRDGYAAESVVDLQVPALPRIAAVASADEIEVEGTAHVVVAVAGVNGRPADRNTPVVASARLGRVAQPRALGGGVWLVAYQAGTEAGTDAVAVRVADDSTAGAVAVALRVVPGAAKRVQVSLAPGPYRPNQVISGKITVVDAHGNTVAGATAKATLGGVAAAVQSTSEGLVLRARVPARLPVSGGLPLQIRAGAATAEMVLTTRADEPSSATLRARADGRRAQIAVAVRDRHGNLADANTFTLRATGAAVLPLRRHGDGFQTAIVAADGTSASTVEIRIGERTVARTRVEFGTGTEFSLGVYGNGGWMNNGGDFSAPRLGAGLGVRRPLGPVEFALQLGIEGVANSDRTQVVLAGAEREVARSVTGVAVSALLRGRLQLFRSVGVAAAVGVVPARVTVVLQPDFQQADQYVENVVGMRGNLGFDADFGPGRLHLGLAYGRARLARGNVVGQLDGLAVLAGYEWWFTDLGF